LPDFLAQAGAQADPVWPYAYVASVADADILGLIEEIAAGRVDAIAFTSAAQVTRLFAAAAAMQLQPRLGAALRRTAIAAVGPVVAGELERHGCTVAIMPHGSFFMKPLVGAIVAALSRQSGVAGSGRRQRVRSS
jgi:uroporphyrinogen-III synthase